MSSSIASKLVDDVEALIDELVFVGTVRARIFEMFFDGPSRCHVELDIVAPHDDCCREGGLNFATTADQRHRGTSQLTADGRQEEDGDGRGGKVDH